MSNSSILHSVIQPKASPDVSTVRPLNPAPATEVEEAVLGNDLRDLEAVLSVLVENAPVAMAMFDRNLRYLLANRQWVTDFGLQDALPLVGRSQFDVFPNLHPGWRGVYDRALLGHIVRSEHDVMQDPAGKPVIFRWEVRPWRHGNDAGVAGLMITCEKFAPVVLPAPEEEGAEGVAPAPIKALTALPMCDLPLVITDLDGVIQEANAAASSLAMARGLQPGSTNFWDAFGSSTARVEVIQALAQAIGSSGSGNAASVSLTTPIVGADPAREVLWGVAGTASESDDPRILLAGIIRDQTVAASPISTAPVMPPPAPIPASVHGLEARKLNDDLAELRNEVRVLQDLEAAYKRREIRQRDVLDALSCGLVVLDARGMPLFHNAHVRNLFGRELKPGTLLEDWLMLACLNDTHRSEVSRIWRESVWRRQLTKVVSLATADGLLKDFELRPAPLADNGMLVTIHDVTDACRMEEMLRATEAKFRAIMHDMPLAAILTDASGAIFEANRPAEQLLGRTKSELRRSEIADLFSSESVARHHEQMLRLRSGSTGTATFDAAVKRDAFEAGDPVSVKLAAITDGGGRLHAVVHFLTPVAADVEVVVARESDPVPVIPASKAEVVQREPVEQCLLRATCHGRIGDWSDAAAALFGWNTDEAKTRSLHQLFRPSDPGGFHAQLEEEWIRAQGGVELPFFHRSGEKLSGLFRFVRDESDGSTQVFARVAQPVEAVVSTPELDRERALLTECHHRITNHLQLISSLLSLQQGSLDATDARHALRASQNRVRAIAALHQHLYHLATGEVQTFTSFTADLVARLRECYEVTAERVQVTLDLQSLQPRAEWLMPFAFILNEAVSNAFQHAFPGDRSGRIQIRFRPADMGEGMLTIEDDGVGAGEVGDGGLGMRVVRLLASQMSGSANLKNIIPSGLSFDLHFPITCVDI